ncbi:MAG: PAQR family membrane homeostasis protein TrhA [Thermoplasmatota archaeon]
MGLKEPFNSISHMVGAGLAIAAFPLLIIDAEGGRAIVSASIYATSLLSVFVMSAIFHGVTHQKASEWLFRLDQSAIYLLIAGTYTPLALLLVRGGWGWSLFGVQWGIAIAGIVILLTVHRTPQWIHQAAYISLGWMALFALPQVAGLPWAAVALILGGGVAYTGGAVLYWRDRPGTLVIGDHGIWHLLVLAGSMAHLVFVFRYVL